jgi:hypothetical protein
MTMRAIGVVLVLAAVGAAPPPSDAASSPAPDRRCAVAKLKAADRYHTRALKCRARAVTDAVAVDVDCLTNAAMRLAADFDKAEAKSGCATLDDASAIGGRVDACLDGLVGALVPDHSCAPVGAPCGTCGSGLCFNPYPNPTTGFCVDTSVAGAACGIDPPIVCPPGQTCLVVQFEPATFVCATPCS